MASTPQKQTVTVAPRPLAKVNFTVRYKATNSPAKDVQFRGDNTLGPAAERNWPNRGRTNALGKAQVNFLVGNVRVLLREPDGYVAEGLPRWDNDKDWALVHDGPFTEGKHNVDISLVCIAAHATVTVTESTTKKPLAGVKVSVGSFGELTNAQGKVKSDLLAAGLLHTLTLTRSGHGPVGGTAEGPVTTTVDFRNMTVVKDQDVAVEMKNLWPRITSSDIEVEGQKFPAWYASFVAPFPANHPTIKRPSATKTEPSYPARGSINSGRFNIFFNNLSLWGRGELSLEEFVAIFLIVDNETGGQFIPQGELGTIDYMFYLNRKKDVNNRLAGEQLVAKGILPASEGAKWNTTTRPRGATPPPTDADLKECDFWKYRGHGFIQTTGYPNFVGLSHVFEAAGHGPAESMTADAIDDAVANDEKVNLPLLRAELGRRPTWSGVNGQQWRDFGLAVIGNQASWYGDLFQWRCEQLYARMSAAARAGTLVTR